jgi:hypothetical protein
MAEDSNLLHNLGRDLANSRAWPNWSADSEFRAARDRTAADRGVTLPPPTQAPPAETPAEGERG